MTRAGVADLEGLAREAGAVELAREAGLVAERLREGRFYVARVGRFKRGKSALVDALVGEAVLPAGVVEKDVSGVEVFVPSPLLAGGLCLVPEVERTEVVRFTKRVLGERFGRPVGPILQVSAPGRLAGIGPARDWAARRRAAARLARAAGAAAVQAPLERLASLPARVEALALGRT